MPWDLLHAGVDPPRAGDKLPATWAVHWSDAGGRQWRGKLNEVCNRSRGKLDEFWRAETWGNIRFLP